MMSKLRIYNTLAYKKQEFSPIDENHVRLYACGPTVYNYAHIGNARMAVVFDILSRVLKQIYPKVTYVSNITDIEDKIIKAARETGEDISTITRKYTDIYNSDMAALGVGLPDDQPRATEHIPQMLDIIKRLIDNGHAYARDGHVLFRVNSFEAYGRLSGRSKDEQIAGARVEVAPYKEDACDFVLWKPSHDDEPGWDSPWGFGRPGWHIECSAMSEARLGLPFDIHGGGADLKFPHHENEVAQSCCSLPLVDGDDKNDVTRFAKYWVHNGFVTVEGEKMSKSLGNVTLVHNLLDEGVQGETIRFTLMSAHYRQPLNWTQNALKQSKAQLDRFYQALFDNCDVDVIDGRAMPEGFLNALLDDLNSPLALAELNDLAGQLTKTKTAEAKTDFINALNLIGLCQNDPAAWLGYGQACDTIDADAIDRLLEERQQARKDKNFARADEIRDELAANNIVIEDTPSGPKWKKST